MSVFFLRLMSGRDPRRGLFLGVWALTLGFYLLLLPPSVTRGGDCGELIAASYTLGIAHPSGYPVWCLLGRLFAALPWGEIAWRYNGFSALCASLAAATLSVSAHRLLDGENQGAAPRTTQQKRRALWASGGAGALFAGFFFVGSQALLAEVYAFAALLGAALLFFALKWKQERDWRDFYTFAWLAGLSPVVHLSGVFLWPILGCWGLWRAPGLSPRRAATLAALWLTGLVPALYLPLRSGLFPAPPRAALDSYFYLPLDWGHPATWAALKNHLAAAQYSGLLHLKSLPDWFANLAHLGHFVLLGFLWATPLLLLGAWSLRRQSAGWVLLLIFVLNVAVETQYDVSDQPNFFFPAYLVMALWMALGWATLLGKMESWGQRWAHGAPASLWPWRMRTLGALGLLATVGAQWFLFAASSAGRGATRVRDGALESARAAQSLAQREGRTVALLDVFDDTLWPFWYAQHVLGKAPDVVTPWGRGLTRVYEGDRMADYVAQLKRRGPVVLAQWDEQTDARFPLVMLSPSGNLCLASDRKTPPSATPLSTTAPTIGPNGLMRARFRRAALWRERGDVPSLLPASLAAFETDFRAELMPRGAHLEVLLARRGYFGARGPAPTQQSVAQGSRESGQISVWRQARRLVLPHGAKAGAWRAAVPLQIEATAPLGAYEVWTRIVAANDARTPWTRTDGVDLTAR